MMAGGRAKTPGGFSLVEVIVAMVVLSVGLLAMAATTGYVYTRIRKSGLDTERAAALQQVTERLRAMPYADIVSRAASNPDTVGQFRFWWSVQEPTDMLKEILVISEGPGYGPDGVTVTQRDTFAISIFDPQ